MKQVILCRDCLKRQGIYARVSPNKIGSNSEKCEICQGLLTQLPSFAKSVRRKLKGYEFETFLVGTSVPQEILDREDEIRSKYKIKGLEGIKTQISRGIGKEVSRLTGRKIDYRRPDLTLVISLGDGNITILPRSIWLFLRYTKSERGLAQRTSVCRVCNGLGCAQCDYKGSNNKSIQSRVEGYLNQKFKAEGCSFIWVGSEDENSLVDGEGRPFFVEIQKPRKRHVTSVIRGGSTALEGFSIVSSEMMDARPISIPQFKMKCVSYLIRDPLASSETGLEPKILKDEIETKFRDAYLQVKLSRKERVVTRKVHSVLVENDNSGNHVCTLRIECDGGIPIRKLVLGKDASVSPNISPYLTGLILDPAAPFDVEDVSLIESKPQLKKERFGKIRRDRA